MTTTQLESIEIDDLSIRSAMLDTIKNQQTALLTNYNVFDLTTTSFEEEELLELSHKFLRENKFLNGFGWAAVNPTLKCSDLYVVQGSGYASKVAAKGKAINDPILKYCTEATMKLKFYGDVRLNPKDPTYELQQEIMLIRREEGVTKGMQFSECFMFANGNQCMVNIFLSWHDSKVIETNIYNKNTAILRKFLKLSKDYVINRAIELN